MRVPLVLGSVLVVGSLCNAQIPDGFGVRFSAFTHYPPGIEFVDLNGVIPVTRAAGLVGLPGFSAGAIDPTNGDLLVGDCDVSAAGGRLIRMSLSGTTISNQTVVTDTGTGLCLTGIAFDQSADIFIADSSSLWKVDRFTNARTLWDTNSYSGVFNAMTIDPLTNRLWLGTYGIGVPGKQIIEYDLSTGPGPGTVIANFPSTGFDGLHSLAFDGGGTIYCASIQPNTVFAFDLTSGTATPTAGAPNLSVNALFFDSLTSLLHMGTVDVVPAFTRNSVWNVLDLSTGTSSLVEEGYFCSSACPGVTSLAIPRTVRFSSNVCSGDGGNQMSCTNCPCSNNAPPGTIGGCINSRGTSTRIYARGDPSVSLPVGTGVTMDLRFNLDGAPGGAFCVLISGSAVAPQNMGNVCFGLSSGAQSIDRDGLSCAVMNLKRHGGRSADMLGEINDPVGTSRVWGGEAQPHVGISTQGGFVSGQTRYFQVTHRDDPLAVCMRGLNTSQAIEVVFTP